MYYIKREAWFGGTKLNGVNCRRSIYHHEVIINNIRDIFIDMNKGTITEYNINIHCDKHEQILNEIDHTYRCMRSLNIINNLISNTNNHVKNAVMERIKFTSYIIRSFI